MGICRGLSVPTSPQERGEGWESLCKENTLKKKFSEAVRTP